MRHGHTPCCSGKVLKLSKSLDDYHEWHETGKTVGLHPLWESTSVKCVAQVLATWRSWVARVTRSHTNSLLHLNVSIHQDSNNLSQTHGGQRGGQVAGWLWLETCRSMGWLPAGGSVLTREAAGSCAGAVGESGGGPPLWQWQVETPGGDCWH